MDAACRFARRASDALAHPLAVLAFPPACGLWLLAGGSVDALTLLLSIAALSFTQLVLLAQASDTRAVQQKLDAIIHGTDADDQVAGIERN